MDNDVTMTSSFLCSVQEVLKRAYFGIAVTSPCFGEVTASPKHGEVTAILRMK